MAQSTSTAWAALWGADGTTQEFAFDIDGTWYGADAEVEHSVDYSLFEEFGIGNASSATLTLSLYADSIPRGATIKRYVRLVSEDGETVSEWLPKGIFYINTRSADDDLWTITAYDAMRRADTVWTPDDDMEFPMPMPDAVDIFCGLMGVDLDSRTTLNEEYTIDEPEDDYTISNILCFIAAAHGGNWIITDAGELYLVPLIPTEEG